MKLDPRQWNSVSHCRHGPLQRLHHQIRSIEMNLVGSPFALMCALFALRKSRRAAAPLRDWRSDSVAIASLETTITASLPSGGSCPRLSPRTPAGTLSATTEESPGLPWPDPSVPRDACQATSESPARPPMSISRPGGGYPGDDGFCGAQFTTTKVPSPR